MKLKIMEGPTAYNKINLHVTLNNVLDYTLLLGAGLVGQNSNTQTRTPKCVMNEYVHFLYF